MRRQLEERPGQPRASVKRYLREFESLFLHLGQRWSTPDVSVRLESRLVLDKA